VYADAAVGPAGRRPQSGLGCAAAGQPLHRPDQKGIRDSAMRAETEKIVEDIKQSVGLLRRHL
jgi:hypothetical protein